MIMSVSSPQKLYDIDSKGYQETYQFGILVA